MKTITRTLFGFLALAVLVVMTGCATSEGPNYQGKKGISPTIDDYYPTKSK